MSPGSKPASPGGAAAYLLRLYVSGNAPNSQRAKANLAGITGGLPPESYKLEIIDVQQEPERALGDNIIVTPTLLKLSSKSTCHIVGDLSDRGLVLETLDL